ncbi:MAG: biotin--[acetyl-CoA-carboxylase] ligase [Lachnospiraceae bacterium]|nr:biotin--[acetyl-CoA-carboxylase] ligase [Lachnospiraceae bacterium]
MASDLLELLNASKDYVSGQTIAGKLGISRNAVWKALQRLRSEGYDIEAVPRKGYRLISSEAAFGQKSIAAALHTQWLGKELLFFSEIDSTNEEIRRRSRKGAKEGLMAVADRQTDGRGRRGRGWTSPAGTSLMFSFLLRPVFPPETAPMLTLVMAIAVSRGISGECGVKTGIKWPNDIVLNGKKLVGILTEMSVEPDYIQEVIIGTGINVSVKDFPAELNTTATSLFLETGKHFSRAGILAAVSEEFERCYAVFCEDRNLKRLAGEYEQLCVNKGKRVRVLDPKGEYEAQAGGIDEYGQLLVTLDSGEKRSVYAGEVSVRGIYGYI